MCAASQSHLVCARARAPRKASYRRCHFETPPVEEPLRFVEGSAVASSSCDAEPRCLRLLGLARVLPMDFNES